MAHLVKEEELTNCPAPPSVVGADFALPLNDDAFDFGGMPSLFLDTTYTFVDSFDLFIDDWSENLEALADPISELPLFGKLEYASSQLSSNNDKVKIEQNPEPQVRPVPHTLKQTPKQKSTQTNQTNRRKRVTRTTTTEKPPRKRAKTEILKLRNEIAVLQAQLSQLQDGGDGTPRNVEAPVAGLAEMSCAHATASLSKASRSLSQAAVELKKLQDAQQLNCCLKSALADKIRVRKAFEAVLETQTHFQAHNVELLQESSETPLDLQCPNYLVVPYHHQSDSLLAEVERLYCSTNRVLKEIDIPQGTGSTFSRTTSDAVYGAMFEQKSSTPIPRDSRFLGEYLWKQVTAPDKHDHDSDPTTDHGQQESERSSTREKRYSMMLETPFGPIKVDCVSLIHRIVEEKENGDEGKSHRVVFVYTSEISVAEGNCTFKEHGWLVLTPDALTLDSTSPSSLFQTFYQLFKAKQGSTKGGVTVNSATTDPANVELGYREYQQELVMHALTSRVRARHMHIERLMRFDPL